MSQYRNIAQAKAIEKSNKQRLLKINPKLDDESGIYFLTRTDEDGINYFYIGQAKHILSRLAQHFSGYQHIDLSLKKRGLYSEENPYGWKVNAINYLPKKLDEMERYWILEYTKNGYQRRYNKTAGGQDSGKEQVNEYRPAKGYRDGIKQGRKNMAKEISHIIDKHLTVSIRAEKQNNQVSQKSFEKFNDLLAEGKGE